MKKILAVFCIIILVFVCGCVGKSLQFNCIVDESKTDQQIVVWRVTSMMATGDAGGDLETIVWSLLDEDLNVVWTGSANIVLSSSDLPITTGVNYYDTADHSMELGGLSTGDKIIVKAPSSGNYSIRATYQGKTCWQSSPALF